MAGVEREDLEGDFTMKMPVPVTHLPTSLASVVQAYIDRHMCMDPRCTGNSRTCPAYAEWLESTKVARTLPKLTRRERLQYYWDRLRYTMAEKIYPEVFEHLDDYD